MSQKIALVTGITGQDGSYLAQLLLHKGYQVHGVIRRSSTPNLGRVDQVIDETARSSGRLRLHYGDLTDSSNMIRLVQETQPDEIYNLAAQSHVHVSFESPEYTANTDAMGALRLLEAIRILGLGQKTRFYQASTSELYGSVQEIPQRETTPFYPRSPYAVAKLYAYWITKNYRESYQIFASNGILFNHESPLRCESFVTRKITRAAARIKAGLDRVLYLGNLDAQRDWGHAREYVEGMWRMMQHHRGDDFVLATGRTTRVRDFVAMAFQALDMPLEFRGHGLDEVGICRRTGRTLVAVDPKFFRPAEVDLLIGDPGKAKHDLGWEAKIGVEELCQEMVDSDYRQAMEEVRRRQPSFSELMIGDDALRLASRQKPGRDKTPALTMALPR